MRLLEFSPSTRKDKKFMVVLETDGKTHRIHFGQAGASDFTKHGSTLAKEAYIRRHQAREDWTDPLTAGFWSRWVLWNLPTVKDSLTDALKRGGIKAV